MYAILEIGHTLRVYNRETLREARLKAIALFKNRLPLLLTPEEYKNDVKDAWDSLKKDWLKPLEYPTSSITIRIIKVTEDER